MLHLGLLILYSPATMEYISLSKIPPSTALPIIQPLISISIPRRNHLISFPHRNPRNFRVFASKEDGKDKIKLSEEELMELKFGKMLGEDPRLTLAKIMGRRANPYASYLEIEKDFYKNKGKIVDVKELPFGMPRRELSVNGKELNLVGPVPKKGNEIWNGEDSESPVEKKSTEPANNPQSGPKSTTTNVVLQKPSRRKYSSGDASNTARLELVRPGLEKGVEAGHGEPLSPMGAGKSVGSMENNVTRGRTNSSASNVVLRKPSVNMESLDDIDESPRFKVKPNLSLKMRTEPVKKEFSRMVLKKPESINVNVVDKKEENPSKVEANAFASAVECDSTSATSSNGIISVKSRDHEKRSGTREQDSIRSFSNVVMSDKPRPIADATRQSFSSSAMRASEVAVTMTFRGGSSQAKDNLGAVQQQLEDSEVEGSELLEQNEVYSGGESSS